MLAVGLAAWIGSVGYTTCPSAAHAQDGSAPAHEEGLVLVPEFQRDALQEALTTGYTEIDTISLFGALRAAITGVFESYCALNNLLPDEQGYDPWTLTLGIGCLAGAGTLFFLTAQRADAFASGSAARNRLERFHATHGPLTRDDAQRFELELADAAAAEERSRWISFALSVGSLAAAAILFTLSAEDQMDPAVGVSIGGGAVIVAVVSLFGWLTEGPQEKAWQQYRAARDAHP